jgi:hypothetical protein
MCCAATTYKLMVIPASLVLRWLLLMCRDSGMDVVSCSQGPTGVAWHENQNQSPGPPTFVTTVIDAVPCTHAHAVDLDGSGSVDVLVTREPSTQPGQATLTWYRGSGRQPPTFVGVPLVQNIGSGWWVDVADYNVRTLRGSASVYCYLE